MSHLFYTSKTLSKIYVKLALLSMKTHREAYDIHETERIRYNLRLFVSTPNQRSYYAKLITPGDAEHIKTKFLFLLSL